MQVKEAKKLKYDKMKEVQRKYREELKKKKQDHEDDKRDIKETIIVVTIIVLFIFSLTPCKAFNKKILFSLFDTLQFSSQ